MSSLDRKKSQNWLIWIFQGPLQNLFFDKKAPKIIPTDMGDWWPPMHLPCFSKNEPTCMKFAFSPKGNGCWRKFSCQNWKNLGWKMNRNQEKCEFILTWTPCQKGKRLKNRPLLDQNRPTWWKQSPPRPWFKLSESIFKDFQPMNLRVGLVQNWTKGEEGLEGRKR